jgi:hypothetical protein
LVIDKGESTMFATAKYGVAILVALAAVSLWTADAQAQGVMIGGTSVMSYPMYPMYPMGYPGYPMGYPGYPPMGYPPYGMSPYESTGDPYTGMANLVDAQGKFLLMREKAAQAQLETKRQTFEERAHEKANTPTANQIREEKQREELRYMQHNPPQTMVWSGRALNVELAHLAHLQASAAQGADVTLDPGILMNINVTHGDDHADGAGLLKCGRTLDWPTALRSLTNSAQLRKQIDDLFVTGKKEAQSGRAAASTIESLKEASEQLHEVFRANVATMSFNQSTTARHFLDHLDNAIHLLARPDAKMYLTGHYSAQGKTVAELVHYMTDHGLTFAPAVAGQEAAYNALHRALVNYDLAVSPQVAVKDKAAE